MSRAKLLVPAGAFDQLKGGEMFSPTQLALLLSLPANFFWRRPLSGKAGEVSTKVPAGVGGSPAAANAAEPMTTAARPPASAFTILPRFYWEMTGRDDSMGAGGGHSQPIETGPFRQKNKVVQVKKAVRLMVTEF